MVITGWIFFAAGMAIVFTGLFVTLRRFPNTPLPYFGRSGPQIPRSITVTKIIGVLCVVASFTMVGSEWYWVILIGAAIMAGVEYGVIAAHNRKFTAATRRAGVHDGHL